MNAIIASRYAGFEGWNRTVVCILFGPNADDTLIHESLSAALRRGSDRSSRKRLVGRFFERACIHNRSRSGQYLDPSQQRSGDRDAFPHG
ncbi:hypothetical protein, partial [Paracoccus yeei]|uniref:hypothetical protein n=1 Tax=Paracoccus yeei TaxID=147645 RepID=UPI0039EFA124